MKKTPKITVYPTAELFSKTVAEDFCLRAMTSVQAKGSFSVALSGGQTPKLFFDTLVSYQKNVPWNQIQFFFGDERYVPSSDPNSNYKMAYDHLFSKVNIDPKHVFRMRTELENPKATALAYEQTLREALKVKHDELPIFDLIYLGLGDDGHTASLIPETPLVEELVNDPNANPAWVSALYVQKLHMDRITFMPKVINAAETIIFLVTGDNKAPAAKAVLEGPKDPAHFPAQLIHPTKGKVFWFLDTAAATLLKE